MIISEIIFNLKLSSTSSSTSKMGGVCVKSKRVKNGWGNYFQIKKLTLRFFFFEIQ